mgnify:CR=1 FL=1
MAQKPRKNRVENVIKDLLDSEIPEIQNVAKQLADRVKQLEEHSSKLKEYVTQIEELATEEADTLVVNRIGGLLKDVDKSLAELRQKPKAAIAKLEAGRGTGAGEEAEGEAESVAGEAEELEAESEVPSAGVGIEKYTTPEGYVIKKARR